MGLLELTGNDVLDQTAWTKHDEPILTGGGHGCFVESSAANHLVYHRKMSPDWGWADREIRSQPFTWSAGGSPVIGPSNLERLTATDPSNASKFASASF